ncbi:hypothetical protein PybrP1_007561 [[Pythium] brassicae (nom. inval.)]|nr:hypothetical protein PybrP1_007561 [[Pythium] brassicae (nom. inval.)]
MVCRAWRSVAIWSSVCFGIVTAEDLGSSASPTLSPINATLPMSMPSPAPVTAVLAPAPTPTLSGCQVCASTGDCSHAASGAAVRATRRAWSRTTRAAARRLDPATTADRSAREHRGEPHSASALLWLLLPRSVAVACDARAHATGWTTERRLKYTPQPRRCTHQCTR